MDSPITSIGLWLGPFPPTRSQWFTHSSKCERSGILPWTDARLARYGRKSGHTRFSDTRHASTARTESVCIDAVGNEDSGAEMAPWIRETVAFDWHLASSPNRASRQPGTSTAYDSQKLYMKLYGFGLRSAKRCNQLLEVRSFIIQNGHPPTGPLEAKLENPRSVI